MKSSTMVLVMTAVFMCALSVSVVMAQPIDYCEGNFDYDLDQDSYDAAVFKTDFGRSPLEDPCPAIDCYTAEQLETQIALLQTQVAQLTALLANITRGMVDGQDTIRFSGLNVQIVDGSGDTEGDVNGLGNLIVGYNEHRFMGRDNRTGSHNIVVGKRHDYLSYGGLVVGDENSISGPYASVSGGKFNMASGSHSSVSGGRLNETSGSYSSVSGGDNNTASGSYSSVSGGLNNHAMGDYSFVGGGGGENFAYGNYAVADYSSIVGGSNNTAGDPNRVNTAVGLYSSVSGGRDNAASGDYASISGGRLGSATADDASVSGGLQNTASGVRSSVSGGENNTASGWAASVSGGSSRSAIGTDDWAAGDLLQDQ